METAEQKKIAFSNRDLRRLIIPLLIEQFLNFLREEERSKATLQKYARD